MWILVLDPLAHTLLGGCLSKTVHFLQGSTVEGSIGVAIGINVDLMDEHVNMLVVP